MEPLDEIFSLLTEERRRFAVYYLDNAEGPVSIDELAEQIYEWENESTRPEIPEDEYRDLVITLKHNHLPQIEEVDHIEYDSTDQTLKISSLSASADVILSVTKAIEQPSETNDIVLERLS